MQRVRSPRFAMEERVRKIQIDLMSKHRHYQPIHFSRCLFGSCFALFVPVQTCGQMGRHPASLPHHYFIVSIASCLVSLASCHSAAPPKTPIFIAERFHKSLPAQNTRILVWGTHSSVTNMAITWLQKHTRDASNIRTPAIPLSRR